MNFPVHFLSDISKLRDYKKPMDNLLPVALAVRCESYHADSPDAGKPSLAALAGLGGEKVCDYFAPLADRMLTIEDTRLVLQMKEWDPARGELTEFVADECRGKMDGSAKILGALYDKFAAKDGDRNPPQADCEFWLVVTDIDSHNDEGDVLAYEELEESVREVLGEKPPPPYVLFDIVGKQDFADNLAGRV